VVLCPPSRFCRGPWLCGTFDTVSRSLCLFIYLTDDPCSVLQLYVALFWDRLMTLRISSHDAVRIPMSNAFHHLCTQFDFNQPLLRPDYYEPLAYPLMSERINSYVNDFRQNSTMCHAKMTVLSIQSLPEFLLSNPHPIPSAPSLSLNISLYNYDFHELRDMDSFFDNY
jgi:hypothetical protein